MYCHSFVFAALGGIIVPLMGVKVFWNREETVHIESDHVGCRVGFYFADPAAAGTVANMIVDNRLVIPPCIPMDVVHRTASKRFEASLPVELEPREREEILGLFTPTKGIFCVSKSEPWEIFASYASTRDWGLTSVALRIEICIYLAQLRAALASRGGVDAAHGKLVDETFFHRLFEFDREAISREARKTFQKRILRSKLHPDKEGI